MREGMKPKCTSELKQICQDDIIKIPNMSLNDKIYKFLGCVL